MSEEKVISDPLAVALFSEIFVVDQLARSRIAKALPKGMELSHFSVLNLLARGGEKSPAELARVFNVTRGAMTNTIGKLEWSGYVHVRPDWDDARRKHVSISPAGIKARDAAYHAIQPILEDAVDAIGRDKVRNALPVIRDLRRLLTGEAKS
ncbi:MAG: MarR family transcriptional regulator [Pseudomonadota bacterium]